MALKVEIASVVSSLFAENCFLAAIEGRSDCLIVDPGLDVEPIFEVLAKKGWTPAAILNTHGHADHIAGNEALKRRFPEAPLAIGTLDAEKLTDPEKNLSAGYGLALISPPANRLLEHGERWSIAGFDLEIRLAPGHSRGHIVFVWLGGQRPLVFGGDVLFQGGIGRSDFADGDHATLVRSIHEQLFTLPDETVVLPGHGDPTTIGEERDSNPFVGRGT